MKTVVGTGTVPPSGSQPGPPAPRPPRREKGGGWLQWIAIYLVLKIIVLAVIGILEGRTP